LLFNLALKGEDYFLGRGLHPSLNKGFKKPLPKGRGLLHEIKKTMLNDFDIEDAIFRSSKMDDNRWCGGIFTSSARYAAT
jgi:hypothetical protein